MILPSIFDLQDGSLIRNDCTCTWMLPRTIAIASQQNAEIFTLTYGSIVRQLIVDNEDIEEVNKELDKMCVICY